MAKVVYIIGTLKGSVAGLTFQGNTSGSIIRARPTVKKTSTFKQQVSHQSHANLLYQWQQLTSVERDLWNDYAAVHTKVNKFGEIKTLTGLNWFESVNYMMILQGFSILTTPPEYTLPAASPDFELFLSNDKIEIDVTGSLALDADSLLIWCYSPTSRQKTYNNQLRKFCKIQMNSITFPLDITTEWEAATGLTWSPSTLFPSVNIFICLQTVSRSSGITSTLLCTKVNTETIEEDETDLFYYSA